MKTHHLIAAMMVLGMAAGPTAFAQDYEQRGFQHQGGGPDQRDSRRDNYRGDRGDRSERRDYDRGDRGERRDYDRGDRRDYGMRPGWQGNYANSQQDRFRGPEDGRWQRNDRGAGPQRNWYSGGRLPAPYRHRQYVVDDWRGRHLQAPPRGYHWIQVGGGDYILAAIATGLILNVLLNPSY